MLFSPEMFQKDKKCGEKSDIWALGMTFYYLLVGSYPWAEAKDPLQLKNMIKTQQIDFEPIVNLKARDLLRKILQKQPENRPTLEEMSRHPWVTNDGTEPLDLSEAK